MSDQPHKIDHEAIPQWAQGLYYDEGLITEVLLYYDDEALYFEHSRGKNAQSTTLAPLFHYSYEGTSNLLITPLFVNATPTAVAVPLNLYTPPRM